MKDNDKRYIFEDDNEDNDIMEYLERDLGAEEKRGTGSNVSNEKEKNDKNKNVIVQFYDNNKMQILWGTLGVLIVVLIIALIVTNIGKGDTDNVSEDMSTEEISQEPTTEEQATKEDDILLAEPVDSEYNTLFEKYYHNSFVEWDESVLSECYDDMQNVSKENYTYLNKYIENIQNIICYVAYETEDGKEIVYVTYDIKFKNIETTAPSMDTFILVKTDNGYRLHNFEVGEEIDVYTNKIQENQQYLELKSNINNQLGIALESNADLKKVYNALKNVSTEEE